MGAPLADGADLEGAQAGGRVGLSAHAERNRAVWAGLAAEFAELGRRNWANPEIDWEIWPNGLEVERLVELQAPEGALSRWDSVTSEGARSRPSEEIWQARKALAGFS